MTNFYAYGFTTPKLSSTNYFQGTLDLTFEEPITASEILRNILEAARKDANNVLNKEVEDTDILFSFISLIHSK